MAQINVVDGNAPPEPQEPTPKPPTPPAPVVITDIEPVIPKVEEPMAPVQPPLEQMMPPATPAPSEVVSDNIPHFGALQPKVDAHPLFSGTKEPKPKNRRWIKRVLLLLATLVVLFGILYMTIDAGLVRGYSHLPFHFFKAPTSAEAPTIAPAETSTTTTPTTTDPYAGWKTYADPNTAVGFMYPPTWTASVPNPSLSCTHSAGSTVTPSSLDIKEAANALSTTFIGYSIGILQYGTQSTKCAPDGNNFKGATYSFLESSDQITSGVLKGDWLTFFGSTTKSNSTKQPDTGLVTVSQYTGSQSSFVEDGTLTIKSKTYQIQINTVATQSSQSGTPAQFDLSKFKTTSLYKNTLLLLESLN